MLRKFLSIIILVLITQTTFATHIVGGEMTYSHITGLTYEIVLTTYRDDYATGAAFDSPATVHLYTEAGVFIESYAFVLDNPAQADQLLVNPYPNPCLDIPLDNQGNPNVLIQKGIYTSNITVPSGIESYYLIYGRCCRNGVIDNLTNAAVQGSMFVAHIPPTNIYSNSSPTFINVPPIFLCENSPFSLDQSAVDVDNDSLFYKLCSPLQALTPANPAIGQFQNPPTGFGPPFTPVVWDPAFDENDPMGGTPLNIGQNTGYITGIPNATGSYVVGLCIEEWRNGVLLSETIRDFQYSVTNCDNIPFPELPATPQDQLGIVVNLPLGVNGIYPFNCQSFTIDFENNSKIPGNIPATALNASYFWDFGDGNSSTAFEPTHTYTDTGTFIVSVAVIIDENGLLCSDTSKYMMFVYPTFTPEFTFDNVCNDDSAKFVDITTSANYDNVIEWNWIFGDGTPNSTEENPAHFYSSSNDYDVILFARSEKGCTRLDTNTITIHPLPNSNFANPTPICAGDDYNFVSTTTILTGTIDSVFWSLGNVVFSYSDSLNNYPTAGVYPIKLVSTSNFGCIDSIEKNLTVNALPTINTSGNDTICPNTSVQVSAVGGINYNWTPTGILNNANIFNPVVTPTSPSYIFVQVTDGNNCINNDSLFIDFLTLPPADAGLDTSVCLNIADLVVFNQNVQLTATGGVSYVWTPVTGLNNPNIPNPLATPLINTDYIVTVTDANNCTNNDTVTVVVLDPSLELIQVTTDSLCFGDTVIVNVLDQGAITSYSWSPVNFITDPTAIEPGFFPPVNTMYTLTVQNYCYQDNDSVLIEVVPIQSLDAGPLDSICMGDPAYQLNATPANFEIYQWTTTDNSISDPSLPNPTIQPIVNSTYYLFAIDSVGTLACTNSDSVDILVFDNPIVDIITPTDYVGFLCLGDSVELSATTNDGISFIWDIDTTIANLNMQSTLVTPIDSAEYFVTVTNGHACSTRDSIIINVQSPIKPDILGDSIMCAGFYVNLEATGGLYYHWYPDNVTFSNPFYSITQANLDSSTQVFVDIRNDCFSDSLYRNITVNQLPEVDAGGDITIIRDDVKGVLDGSGDGKPLWYTDAMTFNGILNSPAQYGPDVQPLSTTTYVLEIENPMTGCKNYDTLIVNVEILTLLAFPTGFSPNGDGTNDLASILKYLNIKNLENFSIYNRFGELIFNTTNINSAWDGTYKGTPQEVGVYTWVINATTKDDDQIQRKGNISLIR